MEFLEDDLDYIDWDHETNEADYYRELQQLINAGHWSFEGSIGRSMMGAIESGHCLLGLKAARDYWGNTIPSRLQVQDGTKGSWEYVKQKNGAVWANNMAKVK